MLKYDEVAGHLIFMQAKHLIQSGEYASILAYHLFSGTLANSANPDQMPHNAASDKGLHCLRTLISVKNRIKMKK